MLKLDVGVRVVTPAGAGVITGRLTLTSYPGGRRRRHGVIVVHLDGGGQRQFLVSQIAAVEA